MGYPLCSKLALTGRCRMFDHDLDEKGLRPGGLGVAGASGAPVNGICSGIASVAALGFLM
jgi:hypothetical protein